MNPPTRPRLIPTLAAAVAILSALSLLAGTAWVSPLRMLHGLLAPTPNLAALILTQIRLPRLLLALGIGFVLGLSGAVLQALLRNPLAEPGLLGVSAGASLGSVIVIYDGMAGTTSFAAPVGGLCGALVTVTLALLLARRGGTLTLILAGAAVSAIAGAGTSLALNLAPSPYAAYQITTWLMGSLTDRSWPHVWLAAPFLLAGTVMLLRTGPSLDALSLGELQATSLGVNVPRTRLLAMGGVALAVGAATAVAGAILFVGLVAPHLVRPLVGHQPRRSLIPAGLAGALIVLAADMATRLLHIGSGPELALGVFISLLGAPFFLVLVLHTRRTQA